MRSAMMRRSVVATMVDAKYRPDMTFPRYSDTAKQSHPGAKRSEGRRQASASGRRYEVPITAATEPPKTATAVVDRTAELSAICLRMATASVTGLDPVMKPNV